MTPGTELSGTVALVTGAGRNIGRAIARSLAAGGALVVVNARTSRAEAEHTVALIEAAGGKALVHLADVTVEHEVGAMVDAAVSQFGRLDFLVNNAAERNEIPFAQMTFDQWRRVLGVMLDGAFLCAKACLPQLIQSRRAAIVNIGGLSAHTGASGRAHVVTAKAGLTGLTRALALELAPHRITVNCVVPGTIETDRGQSAPPRTSLPPIGRRGEPAEVAAVVRMLCGPDARYVTGQTIHVNGGGFMP
jgi:3-oxoacyl-[acyl-carrier protein] reductase